MSSLSPPASLSAFQVLLTVTEFSASPLGKLAALGSGAHRHNSIILRQWWPSCSVVTVRWLWSVLACCGRDCCVFFLKGYKRNTISLETFKCVKLRLNISVVGQHSSPILVYFGTTVTGELAFKMVPNICFSFNTQEFGSLSQFKTCWSGDYGSILKLFSLTPHRTLLGGGGASTDGWGL